MSIILTVAHVKIWYYWDERWLWSTRLDLYDEKCANMMLIISLVNEIEIEHDALLGAVLIFDTKAHMRQAVDIWKAVAQLPESLVL